MENIIKFETGVREFNINGAVTVSFCPTDMNFVETVFDVLEDIDRFHTEYQEKAEKISENPDEKAASEEMFDLSRDADNTIREKINGLFGKDICTPTIGHGSILSPAGGLPIWANIIFMLIDLFDDELVKEKEKTNPRIKKYTEKYKKRSARK